MFFQPVYHSIIHWESRCKIRKTPAIKQVPSSVSKNILFEDVDYVIGRANCCHAVLYHWQGWKSSRFCIVSKHEKSTCHDDKCLSLETHSQNKSYYKEVNQSRFVLNILYHERWLFVNQFHRKLTYCLQQTVFSKHFVQCENTRKTPITGTDVSHRKEWWENQIDSFNLRLFCEKSTCLIADALHAWKRWYTPPLLQSTTKLCFAGCEAAEKAA